jgi:hypothetical protein
MIDTKADIPAGVKLRSPLASNDSSSLDKLPCGTLYTQHLGFGISSIAGGPNPFFMRHV